MSFDQANKMFQETLESKEMKAYMDCLKKSKSNKKTVDAIESTFEDLKAKLKQVNEMQKKPGLAPELFDTVIEFLQLSKKLLVLDSDRDLLTHGAKECTEQLVDLTIYKNKQQQKSLETSETMLKQLSTAMAAAKKKKNAKK